MNDGDNDYSASTWAFTQREKRLQRAAEAIAVLGLTPKLEAELVECRADQLQQYSHDFVINKDRWL